ncbi:GNAT family N-acetyltransferase [Caballeronia sp. LZ062]|uniref:GNAT family N-acetyltransferase n=1 Tax=unclassified Caballeronia TaxID=2646786 RepID=UPI00285AB875|nr:MULTISPECIES: GNAT family N-acetyltransferase [unclassified Caballeronia]MDR5855118.1 GNAT family N-acetyltransferase [Caballeronia sp. LZ050]MDR5870352.1 GNAT family N-acetyltransferase [Caballeronia sp. LZ062]
MPTLSDLVLREAQAGDTALIASMHARSWASAYRGILPDAFIDQEMPNERAAHWHARMTEIAAGAGCVLIAEAGGQPVGFVCVAAPDETGGALIDNLHALPAFRGCGAGSAMLHAAAEWARARGARHLYLSVLEANTAAIGFYESRGWTLSGREADRLGGVDVVSLRYVHALT